MHLYSVSHWIYSTEASFSAKTTARLDGDSKILSLTANFDFVILTHEMYLS